MIVYTLQLLSPKKTELLGWLTVTEFQTGTHVISQKESWGTETILMGFSPWFLAVSSFIASSITSADSNPLLCLLGTIALGQSTAYTVILFKFLLMTSNCLEDISLTSYNWFKTSVQVSSIYLWTCNWWLTRVVMPSKVLLHVLPSNWICSLAVTHVSQLKGLPFQLQDLPHLLVTLRTWVPPWKG